MPAPRDHYRYLLFHEGKIVYVGITNDLERREQEHREGGTRFTSMSPQGPRVTEEGARRWEEERLETYRQNHGGKNPKYNRSREGCSDRRSASANGPLRPGVQHRGIRLLRPIWH